MNSKADSSETGYPHSAPVPVYGYLRGGVGRGISRGEVPSLSITMLVSVLYCARVPKREMDTGVSVIVPYGI